MLDQNEGPFGVSGGCQLRDRILAAEGLEHNPLAVSDNRPAITLLWTLKTG
jgi:hypothetical protein